MSKLIACIVTYKSPINEVKQAVDSFLQTSLSKKIYIIDNDSGVDYLAKLHTQISMAEIISVSKNAGFGAGNNIAINMAKNSEYFLCLNPDIIIAKNTIEKLIEYMDINSDVGLISPRILNSDGSMQYLNKRNPTIFTLFSRRFLPRYLQNFNFIKHKNDEYSMQDIGYDNICEPEFISGCFMLWRNEILQKLNGFDEDYFMYMEDADITRRAKKLCKTVYYPDVTVTHLWKRGSHNNIKLTIIMIKSMIIYFNKWGWKFW